MRPSVAHVLQSGFVAQKRNTVREMTAEEHFAEAVRYFRNAKQRLREAAVRDDLYDDLKPVREACQTAYLAVLHAVRGHLLSRGVPPQKLPEDPAAYGAFLARQSAHNGRLVRNFHLVYEELHVIGHYTGTRSVHIVKDGFDHARWIIERLTGRGV
jgi:ferritin-like protein